ncbi:hypothetical protein ACIBG5_34465 [Kribbella sp. NPDC050241]|uniref:hypothetical protein n=1 Tax=Kribbella sp. NPDC050241 TaxID=3364115 RepID=UPI00379D439C
MLDEQLKHALTVLTRLAQREPAAEATLAEVLAQDIDRHSVIAADVAAETGEPLIRILSAVLTTTELPTETLDALLRRTSSASDALFPVREAVTGQLLKRLGTAEPARRTRLLERLAAGYRRRGDPERAIETIRLAATVAEVVREDLRPFAQMNVLLESATILQTLGTADEALADANTALALADRHLDSRDDPRRGRILLTQAEILLDRARFAEAATSFRRSSELWRTALRRADVDIDLAASQLDARRQAGEFESRGQDLRTAGSGGLHVAVGGPGADLWGGPLLSSYRVNTVIDLEMTHVITTVPAGLPQYALAASTAGAGLSLVLAGHPRRALGWLDRALEAIDALDPATAESLRAEALLCRTVALHQMHRAKKAGQALGLILTTFGTQSEANATGDEVRTALSTTSYFALKPLMAAAEHDGWNRGVDAYLDSLISIMRTSAHPLGQELLRVLLDLAVDAAVTYNEDSRPAASDALLTHLLRQRVWTTVPQPTFVASRHVKALAVSADAYSLLQRPKDRLRASREAVRIATSTQGISGGELGVAWFSLAHALSAVDRLEEAESAALSAISSICLEDPLLPSSEGHLLRALEFHKALIADDELRYPGPPPGQVVAALRRLMAPPETLADDPAGRIGVIAFSAVSALAKARDAEATDDLCATFLKFAESNQSARRLQFARAALWWNVMMCFVDEGYSQTAIDRVMADTVQLVERSGTEEPYFVTEQAKTATELIQAHMNRNDRSAARAVAQRFEQSLRSPNYTEARARDLGQSREEWLNILDALLS